MRHIKYRLFRFMYFKHLAPFLKVKAFETLTEGKRAKYARMGFLGFVERYE